MRARNIENSVITAISDTPVVLLNGARQTGKTTLAKMLAASRGADYFSLDDVATLSLANEDPVGMLRSLKGPVVLDEIQKAPGLLPAIKVSVDENRMPGRFLLTGSANVMTLPNLSESLAGRMEVIPMYPFSAGELAGRREGFLSRLFGEGFAEIAPPEEDGERLAERITRGGYPEVLSRDDAGRRAAWFSSYELALLQRDVRDLARVDALRAMPNLLKLLAARSSGLLNVADVGREAGLPNATLHRYMALLEMVFLVHRVPAWSANIGKRLVKAPKLHLVDSGLACHLIGADARRLLADRALLGRMLESFVVGELRKQISWSDPRVVLHHYRSVSGAEVDVILEKPDGSVAAVEVKAAGTVSRSDFEAMESLREQLGEAFRAGVVLYTGERAMAFGERLWMLPVPALWME